jgi:hypothetical protein
VVGEVFDPVVFRRGARRVDPSAHVDFRRPACRALLLIFEVVYPPKVRRIEALSKTVSLNHERKESVKRNSRAILKGFRARVRFSYS